MNFIKLSIVLFLITGLIFFGCKKTADSPFSTPVQNMMRENALAQAAFDDVLKIAENILLNNGDAKLSTLGAELSCYFDIDTVVTGVNKKTYTITFDRNCTSYDGKLRTGKMILELDGINYNTDGAILKITFDNYGIDLNLVKGKIVVKNKGGGLFTVQVSDNSGLGYANLYYFSQSKNIQWKTFHYRVITENNGDNIIINNKYGLLTATGATFEGITSDNNYYLANPTIPLQLDYSCTPVGALRYPVMGTLDFKMGNDYRSVNYGDTLNCDRAVKMIANGVSSPFTLY